MTKFLILSQTLLAWDMCPFVLFLISCLFHTRYQIHTLGRELRITSSPLANTQLDRNYSRVGDLIFERLQKKKISLQGCIDCPRWWIAGAYVIKENKRCFTIHSGSPINSPQRSLTCWRSLHLFKVQMPGKVQKYTEWSPGSYGSMHLTSRQSGIQDLGSLP